VEKQANEEIRCAIFTGLFEQPLIAVFAKIAAFTVMKQHFSAKQRPIAADI